MKKAIARTQEFVSDHKVGLAYTAGCVATAIAISVLERVVAKYQD